MMPTLCCLLAASLQATGAWPHIETSFELRDLPGNPFVVADNDIHVSFAAPDGKVTTVPAFFDGGTTWRARLTPGAVGRWTVASLSRNGQPLTVTPQPRTFDVTGEPKPGIVRLVDGRFQRDGGEPYLPLGCNIGWGDRNGDVPWYMAKFAAAGCNWSRVWMCHWDGKNLEWTGRKLPPGELDLDVAHRWDGIVDTAERLGIAFQMVLQHHGQYSTTVNPNWPDHPWNKARGGWLDKPEQFFTDPQALALTRDKYRYIVARWGYSPAILAWELFNEVQYVDAVRHGATASVAQWHRDMAAWLRAQDAQRHLVVTSSDLSLPIYETVDYLQPHTYVADAVGAVTAHEALARAASKPMFLGEVGSNGDLMADDGTWLHRALWAGLTADTAAPPQYWTWNNIEKQQAYGHFAAATAFVRQSGLAARAGLHRLPATVATTEAGPLRFGPGGGWKSGATAFDVQADGTVTNLAQMGGFLHGNYHRTEFAEAVFTVTLPRAGSFAVSLSQIARAGAKLRLSVDGAVAAQQDYPAADADQNGVWTLTAPVPAGRHTITLRNDGADWVVLREFVIDPCVPALAVRARGGGDFAVLWIESRRPGPAVTGDLTLSGLKPGSYRLRWWDTLAGAATGEQAVTVPADGRLSFKTPPVAGDVAGWLAP